MSPLEALVRITQPAAFKVKVCIIARLGYVVPKTFDAESVNPSVRTCKDGFVGVGDKTYAIILVDFARCDQNIPRMSRTEFMPYKSCLILKLPCKVKTTVSQC